jgi:hypothetical protein
MTRLLLACAGYFIYRPQITGSIVLNTPLFHPLRKRELGFDNPSDLWPDDASSQRSDP